MESKPRHRSIFSQKLDRVAFIAYFLGAVVPLVALGVVVERFVLPSLDDNVEGFALIGLLVSIAGLSLGSFFTLRRTTRESLARIDRDNDRLSSLLDVSTALAGAEHAADTAEAATRCAVRLGGATAAYQLMASPGQDTPALLASAGEDAHKLFQAHGQPIAKLAQMVIRDGSPVIRGGKRAADRPAEGFTAAAIVPLTGDGETAGALAVTRTGSGAGFDADQVSALTTLAALTSVSLRNADLRDAQRNFFIHVTDMLVTALDGSIGYNKGHGNRVAQHANRIGRELGLDDRAMQRLHFAALLHDIGLLKIDPSVKHNSRACQKHTLIGARMLGRVRLWEDLGPIVQAHHERWDGTGYPNGIAGAEIPLEARIIALCDSFDAMTSSSSYKTALDLAAATEELEQGSGTQFDPELAQLFKALAARGEITIDA